MRISRASVWLAQAENDFLWGQNSAVFGHFAQACFISQQVAEKALKALTLARGFYAYHSHTHSIREIADALGIKGTLSEAALRLDQYYIPTRYPDAYYGGAPFQFYTRVHAVEALECADLFLEIARKEIEHE